MRRTVATIAAAALAVAAPAAADAARAPSGTFYDGSDADGLLLTSSGRSITELELYCAKRAYWERENAYKVERRIRIRRNGSFSYRGRAARYGKQHQFLGYRKVRLSGRFVGSNRVRLTRALSGCDTRTVSAGRTG